MKVVETFPNRVAERSSSVDIAPIFDAILGHSLRGSLSEWDSERLRCFAPSRLQMFLICGETVLYPQETSSLPLEIILSSQRQNSNAFYLHCVADPSSLPRLQHGVYHTQAMVIGDQPYILGLYGSMADLQNAQTQVYLQHIVEALRSAGQSSQSAVEKLHSQIADKKSATLVLNQAGEIIVANSSAIQFVQKDIFDVIGSEYQTLVRELDAKTAIAKSTLTPISFGEQHITLVTVNSRVKEATAAPFEDSIGFLFQLLRDKLAIFSIASEYLTTALPPGEGSQRDLAFSLAQELIDFGHHLQRVEMLVGNNWKQIGKHNIASLTVHCIEKWSTTFSHKHTIQMLSPEGTFYWQCNPQAVEVALDTVLWMHLSEQDQPTNTTVGFTISSEKSNMHLTIVTQPAHSGGLRAPKAGWRTYLAHFGTKMNVDIDTNQDSVSGAITTNMQFYS